jgi:hypothetical protein
MSHIHKSSFWPINLQSPRCNVHLVTFVRYLSSFASLQYYSAHQPTYLRLGNVF